MMCLAVCGFDAVGLDLAVLGFCRWYGMLVLLFCGFDGCCVWF